jgi:hypothetical protein
LLISKKKPTKSSRTYAVKEETPSVEYLPPPSIELIQGVDCIGSNSNKGIELPPTGLICWVVLLIIWWGAFEYVN